MNSIRNLIADDSFAIGFQSMGQYRTALLKALDVTPPAPVAPVSDSKMSAYNHRAAARFAILDRLGKAIDFNSHGWRLTSEGERWTRLMAEQEQDECEMGL